MKKLVIPLALAVVGAAAGAGFSAYLVLNTPAEAEKEMATNCDPKDVAETEHLVDAAPDAAREFVKFSNQFVVPLVAGNKVGGLALVTITLDVEPGHKETIYEVEPKLRNDFLLVMFDHANMGGFDGAFTEPTTLDTLRRGLKETAHKTLGGIVNDVLITDIARTDT